MNIHYLTGDATQPIGTGNKIIAHICNDVGAWGAGFVLAVAKRWAQPKADYLKEQRLHGLKLGTVGLVQVAPDMWVANMVAQHDIRTSNGVPPIRYEALKNCLTILAENARALHATVHMPRIGCGLAGGTWQAIEPLIHAKLKDVPVVVYDLPR